MTYETTCFAGLCDVCQQDFLIPTRTPLDMLVTCPRCEHVDECEEYLAGWNELHEKVVVSGD